MLCDDVEGWDGVREEAYVYTMGDSFCCAAETNTTLQSTYTPKIKEK